MFVNRVKKQTATALIALGALVGVLAFSASAALAETECSGCKPWWHLTPSARPAYLPPEGKGQIVLTAGNLGDAEINGATDTVQISDTLPVGLKAVSITALAGKHGNSEDTTNRGPVQCSTVTTVPLTCLFAGTLPPYDQIEVVIEVQVEKGASSVELNQASVSGGGAAPVSLSRPLAVSGEAVPFGLQDNEFAVEDEDGAPTTQAGSHPFQVTNTLVLNQTFGTEPILGGPPLPTPAALTKDLNVRLPPGFVGNPTPFARCTLGQFLKLSPNAGKEGVNGCATDAVVGVASVLVSEPYLGLIGITVPVFNLEPSYGEPARFGFYIPVTATPVILDTSLRGGPGTGEEYAVTVTSLNTTQIAALDSAEVTFWGVPGDPRHNSYRGFGCVETSRGQSESLPCATGAAPPHPPAFLIMPTSCSTSPLQSSVQLDSYAAPTELLTVPTSPALPTLGGCNRLAFSPTIQAEPTTDSAASASGLDFNLYFHDEGLTSAEGLAQSHLKDTTVTLPEGFTINPSSGVGLGGCTPADFGRESVGSAPGAGCPNDSKLGEVSIETPLLSQKILGSIFIAQPYENPFPEAGHPGGSLIALYVVAKNPETGIMVKLAGKVTPNPVTGQLVTTFENNPQLPFDHFNFHFREGQQAPLITPATCGTYTTTAGLTPWSEPASLLTDTSSFTITSGVGGGACPSGGEPPFKPAIAAGTQNNNAGAYSPFYLHLTRGDGDQEISGFSTNMPPGLSGSLTGIPFCPEADIALARSKTGTAEESSPSCPSASEVGHTLTGTGVGAVLAYVPGKIYLAGPYNGDPFSLVSVTAAKVGPFDLGTVVLRFGLKVDPYTAQVSVDPTASEPIPTILHGIVTHVRDIRVYIQRAGNAPFVLNPTSCAPMAISSTLNAAEGATATVASPFQAASCANLKFAPRFSASTAAKTSKAKGASLHVDLTYPAGAAGTYANIARTKVDLPKQLPSRLTTLQKACTNAQFLANPAGCPAASMIGYATVHTPILPVPLVGPAIFVSHGGEAFPSLIIVLQGYGVTVDLVGTTNISPAGITSTTFKAVPDDPVGSFELTLPEGKYSALAANGNLCKSKLKMPTEFVAQNGAAIHESTKISVTGCAKVKALTRGQRLAKALRACHNQKGAKRAACEAKARKQDGSLKTKGNKKK